MTFPTTDILDNFDRADAGTLGANWSQNKRWTAGTVNSAGGSRSQVYCPCAQYAAYWDYYYNPSTYGPDCESYISVPTIGTIDDADEVTSLYLRILNPGQTFDGYRQKVRPMAGATNDQWMMGRIDDGAETQLGATVLLDIANACSIGIEAIGSTIKGYHKPSAGAWVEVISRSDETYSDAGYVGFYSQSEWLDWRLDNFGGGTVVASPPSTTGEKFPQSAVTASEDPWLDEDWTSPTNIYSENATNASITPTTYDSPDQSYVLKGYNFDMSGIPDGATIVGVVCVCNAYYANGTVSMDLMQLLDVSRAKVGTNQCSTAVLLGTGAGGTVQKGSRSDLWANALTAAWLKDPDFGVALGFLATGSNSDVFVDYVSLEVFYTTAGGAYSINVYDNLKSSEALD